MLRTAGLAAAAAVLLTLGARAGEKITAGPQAGDDMKAFDVHDVTGPTKGKTLCLV
jgi:hypothetical protein